MRAGDLIRRSGRGAKAKADGAHAQAITEILIDRGEYGEQLDLLAQAIGAVNRLNDRQGARNAYDRCVKAIFETGEIPPGCAAE